MTGGGVDDGSMAVVGEDRVGESAVGRIGLAADEPTILEAGDDARQSDSDALVTSASELIRIVCPGRSESIASTWYSTIASPESRCSCRSIDQGSQVSSRTTASHEWSSSAVSHSTVAWSLSVTTDSVTPALVRLLHLLNQATRAPFPRIASDGRSWLGGSQLPRCPLNSTQF